MLPMSAQDTIPYSNTILSYPFSYHHYDSISMSTIPCNGLNCYNYPPYSIHNEWYMQYRETNEPLVYGIAITTDSLLPQTLTMGLYSLNFQDGTVQPIDSLNFSDNFYHKKMFYRYEWPNPTIKETVPCHIVLFDEPVPIPNTFYLKASETTAKYKICELKYPDSNPSIPEYMGLGAYGFQPWDEGIRCHALSIWGGIFPIMQLPCPPAAKPTVAESRQGLVRFNWWEGDTNLYQIAISSYPADSTLFVSDTLTDSTFIVNDSVMAALNLAEGRYYIHLRRACNYMDSPYHSLLWSKWGEGRMFYYASEPEGITSVDEAAPVFALSPNPASQTVTVEVFGVTSQGETRQGEETRQAASLQIVNLEGRIVAESRIEGEKTDLDVSHLSAGVYLVRLQTPQGSATRKLTIAR